MRKVATIPIRTAADLAQTPYTDRTIERNNTWRWKRGRTVYELVAPGGDVYVMQAYAQIIDPDLTLGELPRARPRLDLPAGWRYRTRKLRRTLARRPAHGDGDDPPGRAAEHLPAGQRRAGRPRKRAPREHRRARRRSCAATPGTVEDHGTVTGHAVRQGHGRAGRHAGGRAARRAPSGCCSRAARSRDGRHALHDRGRRDRLRRHRRSPAARAPTAASRAARSRSHDHNTIDGQNGVVTLTGFARY